MTRKSKQPGGCGPLTRYEKTHYAQKSGYGTVTARLGTESQIPFGDCCLSHHAAIDPVATPSGHVYSREAIVSYLLTKTKELKEERTLSERRRKEIQTQEKDKLNQSQTQFLDKFRTTQDSILQLDSNIHSAELKQNMTKQIAGAIHTMDAKNEIQNQVKRSSFWLAEAQPQPNNTMQLDSSNSNSKNNFVSSSSAALVLPPSLPQRPSSPMSGQPLKLKDLISLQILREKDEHEKVVEEGLKKHDSSSTSSSYTGGRGGGGRGRVVCAISGKVITNQPVVTIQTTGYVLLKQVYETVIQPTMIDPMTGMKLKSEDVLELQCGKSGYAASGSVTAKRYRPTLT